MCIPGPAFFELEIKARLELLEKQIKETHMSRRAPHRPKITLFITIRQFLGSILSLIIFKGMK